MKSFKIIILFSILLSSCAVDDLHKIDLLNLQTGAYMRNISPAAAAMTYSKAGISSASLTFVIEAVDPDKGKQFANYELAVEFRDRTASNGNNSKALKALKTITPNGFAADATSGYLRGSYAVSANEIMNLLGVKADDITKGDSFEITSTLVTTDGRRFTNTNASADVLTGAFYNSGFFYRINIVD